MGDGERGGLEYVVLCATKTETQREKKTQSVEASSPAIFNLHSQPDRAGVYIVRHKQLG